MDERWGRDGSLIAVLDSLSPLAREAQPIMRGEWKNEAPGLLGKYVAEARGDSSGFLCAKDDYDYDQAVDCLGGEACGG